MPSPMLTLPFRSWMALTAASSAPSLSSRAPLRRVGPQPRRVRAVFGTPSALARASAAVRAGTNSMSPWSIVEMGRKRPNSFLFHALRVTSVPRWMVLTSSTMSTMSCSEFMATKPQSLPYPYHLACGVVRSAASRSKWMLTHFRQKRLQVLWEMARRSSPPAQIHRSHGSCSLCGLFPLVRSAFPLAYVTVSGGGRRFDPPSRRRPERRPPVPTPGCCCPAPRPPAAGPASPAWPPAPWPRRRSSWPWTCSDRTEVGRRRSPSLLRWPEPCASGRPPSGPRPDLLVPGAALTRARHLHCQVEDASPKLRAGMVLQVLESVPKRTEGQHLHGVDVGRPGPVLEGLPTIA